jgi:hypothetical protein
MILLDGVAPLWFMIAFAFGPIAIGAVFITIGVFKKKKVCWLAGLGFIGLNLLMWFSQY